MKFLKYHYFHMYLKTSVLISVFRHSKTQTIEHCTQWGLLLVLSKMKMGPPEKGRSNIAGAGAGTFCLLCKALMLGFCF